MDLHWGRQASKSLFHFCQLTCVLCVYMYTQGTPEGLHVYIHMHMYMYNGASTNLATKTNMLGWIDVSANTIEILCDVTLRVSNHTPQQI